MALEKPSGSLAGVITGGLVGDTGTAFYFKVMEDNSDFWSPEEDVTGDGDTAATYENNELLYGRFVMHGAMIGSEAAGIANLKTNSSTNTISMIFHYGGSVLVTRTVLVTRIRYRWRPTSAFVAVSIIGRDSTVEPVETSP